MLNPGERRGQASTRHDLEDLHEVREFESGTAEFEWCRDPVEAGVGQCAPVTIRDLPAGIDDECGGKQDLVGDLARQVHQMGGHARRRYRSAPVWPGSPWGRTHHIARLCPNELIDAMATTEWEYPTPHSADTW